MYKTDFQNKKQLLGLKKMSREMWQGCPVSALLYIYDAEILALKLKG